MIILIVVLCMQVIKCVYNVLNCRYVRALGAMYMRLTGTSIDCFKYLEPLYLDYRKLRKMNKNGGLIL